MFEQIAAYLRRPKMRAIPQKVRAEHIQRLFAKTSLKKMLDEKFLEGLQKRRDELQQRLLRIFIVQITVLGLLLLCLTPLRLQINVFGIQTTDLRQLREILLIIFASVAFRAFQWRAESTLVREILEAALLRKASKDGELLYVLMHRFGVGGLPSMTIFKPALGMLPGVGYQANRAFEFIMSKAIELTVGLAFFIIELRVMIDIYQEPSFGVHWSVFVIAYVLAITLAVVLWGTLQTVNFVYRRASRTAARRQQQPGRRPVKRKTTEARARR